MNGSALLLCLSVLSSLLAVALGPRAQSNVAVRKTLLEIRWIPPVALRRTRVALLVISAALLYSALVPPSAVS